MVLLKNQRTGPSGAREEHQQEMGRMAESLHHSQAHCEALQEQIEHAKQQLAFAQLLILPSLVEGRGG